MDGFDLHSLFSHENISRWLEMYKGWGWWAGMLLAFSESLIPVLPLAGIAVANEAAFGFWKGSMLTEIGSVLGALLIYFVAKKFGDKLGDWLKRKIPKTKKMFKKLKNKGFTSIFFLSCLPFTPSLLLNLAAGITKVPFFTFLSAIVLGKAVLILVFSYFGHNLQNWLQHPWKLGLAVGGLLAIWLITRAVDKHQEAKDGQAG